MSTEPISEPWEKIEGLVRQESGEALHEFLDTLPPSDVARAISRLDEADRSHLLTLLDPTDAADLMEELSDLQAADLIESLRAEDAAAIVYQMESDQRADVLSEMDEDDAEAILSRMDPEGAADARQLMAYPPDTAGGVMVTEFVVYRDDALVGDVLDDLRSNVELYSGIGVQYAYVQSASGTLVGVLRLRDLVLSPNHKPIREVMIVNPISVLASAPLYELEQLFDRYMFMGIPVIEEDGHMVGVVERADLEEAQGEESEKRFMRFSGIVGGDELRTMPLANRSVLRLSWLVPNLFLSVGASSVILVFEGTVLRFAALAMLLPVVANASGCSGNQSVAVSIRELGLGIIRPQDFFRVLRQEIFLGLANGMVLGVLLAVVTYLVNGDIGLGVVVGVALALNTVVAVLLGAGIPLVLKKLHIDPAAGAAPMLTTIVDMCGFLFILGLVSAFLM